MDTNRHLAGATAAVVLAAAADVAVGGLVSWTGSGSDANWTTPANWQGEHTPPQDGDDVEFGQAANQDVVVDANAAIATLRFCSADPYALRGPGTVTLGSAVIQDGSGTVSILGSLVLPDGGCTVGGSGSGKMTLSGPIGGSGGLVFATSGAVSDAPNWRLTAPDSSYSGPTQVTCGVLELLGAEDDILQVYPMGYNSVVGSGALWINGGELRLTPRGTGTIGEYDTGFRMIRFGANGGTLDVNGPTSMKALFSFDTTDGASAPAVVRYATIANPGDSETWQGWSFTEHALRIWRFEHNGPLRLELSNGALAWFCDPTATFPQRLLTVRGQPGGDPSAPSASTNIGRLIFAYGDNKTIPLTRISFQDAVQVTGNWGEHTLDCDLTVEAGAAVAFQGVGNPANTDYKRLILGSGEDDTLTIEDGALGILDVRFRTDKGGRVYTGGLVLNAATVIRSGGRLWLKQTVAGGPVGMNLVGYVQVNGDIRGQGDTTDESVLDVMLPFDNDNGQTTGGVCFGSTCDLTVDGHGTGGLRVNGTATNVANLLTTSRLGGLAGSGGYFTVAASDQPYTLFTQWSDPDVGLKVVDSYKGGDDVVLGTDLDRDVYVEGGGTLNTAGCELRGRVWGEGTITGTVSMSGALSGSVAITGALVVQDGGTVTLGGDGQIAPTASVTVNSGGTFDLGGHTDTSQGVTLNGGSLTGQGDTGAVTVNSGGTVSPGSSIGTITAARQAWNQGGVYLWEVCRGGCDLLKVLDELSFAGPAVLNVQQWGPDPPANGDYVLFEVGGTIGAMPGWTINLPVGWTCDGLAVRGGQVVLEALVVPQRLIGDADRDGDVDAFDYVALKRHAGASGDMGWEQGDFDGDGDVDRLDFLALRASLRAGASGGPVPEPSMLWLLVLGGVAVLRRKRAS
jgi:hypothetical protein